MRQQTTPTVEDIERRLARRQAVDEAYLALEKYQVNRRRITFLPDDYKRTGGYGIVRKAHLHPSAYLPVWLASRHYDPPQVVAVKQIKISAADDLSDVKGAFTKEMLVWSSLEAHPGIAKFTGFYADFELSEAWLISPWEPNGNVSEFIRQHKLEVPEKLSLIYDTIDALIFLHQLNPPICHGDVKSANVLVSSKFRAVLCDFGLARLHEDSGFGRLETSTGFKGSIRWCSPELINGHPRTPSSDVYAWAWLAWEIMTGELPYEGTLADYAIILKIFEGPQPHVDGEFRLSDCLQVWDLITRCWAAVPEQRPTSSMCRTAITSLPRCPPVLGDQARSAPLLENLGDLESWKGNYEEGFAYLEQALLLYEQEENNRGIASVLCKQASVSYRHSYPGKALKAASLALDKLRTLNDPLGTAETLFLMGSSLGMQSKNDDAMAFLEEALEIFRAHSNDVGIVQCLERMGEVHRRRGDFEEALSVLEEAVALADECGDKLGEAKVRTLLGWVNWGQNNVEEAVSFVSEACDIARRIGWAHGVCTALWRLGIIQERQGNPMEAEMLFQESITISRQSNARWRLAQGLWELGYCLRGQGRLAEAAEALEESCSIYQDISHGDWEFPYTAALLAGVKRDQGATAPSLYWYDVAIAEYRKIPDKPKLSGVLADKGPVLEDTESYDEAALHFEASMVIDMELEDDHGVSWNRRRLSKIPKTAIRWESRKFTRARAVEIQRGLPLLCDVRRLQRRIPHLRTGGLGLDLRVGEVGDPLTSSRIEGL